MNGTGEWKDLNQQNLDAMLRQNVPDAPPDAVVRQVTPWRRAANRILFGLFLTTFTVNIMGLHIHLPLLGALLCLLGARLLRQENLPFRWVWRLALVRLVYEVLWMAANTTVYLTLTPYRQIVWALEWGMMAMTIVQLILLWEGYCQVCQRVNMPLNRGATVPLLCLGLLWVLALSLHWFWVLLLLPVGIFFYVLLRLRWRFHKLEAAGYAIQAAPVGLPGTKLTAAVAGATAVGVVCGCLLGSRYPMDWTLVDPVEDPQALEIQTQLKDLGYPAEALADLTQEDLLACEGAWLVVVEEADLPVNEGHTVTYDEYGITRTEQVYDTRELHLTTVAVRLPEQGQAWRVFHHFRFTTSPGFPGTEAVEIFADTMGTWGWLPRSERQGTGRLLYDRQGQTYTTSYTTLEWVEENGNTFLRGTFSLPENGTNQRGYLAYEVDAVYFERSTRLFSHFTYAHQTGKLRFLHRTALDYINASILGRGGPFVAAEGGIDLLSTPEGAE